MLEKNEQGKVMYLGVERRRGNEPRQCEHRREGIRYEPLKPLRRHGRERRKHFGWDDNLQR